MKALVQFATSPLGWWLSVLITAAGTFMLSMIFAAVLVWGINPCGPFFWGH